MKKYENDFEMLVQLGKLAESSERFSDMCGFIKMLAQKELEKAQKKDPKAKAKLNVEQRNMLSVAYKNEVGARRASWRTLSVEINDRDTPGQSVVEQLGEELAASYTKRIETELEDKCRDVLDVIEKKLLPLSETIKEMKDPKNSFPDVESEEAVFYLKMAGDYYRYLAEFKETEEVKNAAAKNYDTAIAVANRLAPTHPTRLGLILNASVCRYEILKKKKAARDLAKEGFDAAIQKLDSLNDATYKDSTLIMQLLRDNLTIWTSSETDDENGQMD